MKRKRKKQRIRTRIAAVKDIEIAYKVYGEGHPLIMIMGLGSTMDLWPEKVLKTLAEHYKVIIFDNRGMGRSTASDKEFSMELFAEDTANLMDALGIKSAHILAWSMGTNIAQELALRHPKKINKLVLYSADYAGKKEIRSASDHINALIEARDESARKAKRALRELFPLQWLQKHSNVKEYMPRAVEKTAEVNLQRQWKAVEKWKGTYKRLGRIKAPTLLLTGDHDMAIPSANSFIMGQLIPDSRVMKIKGGGHGAIYQYPALFCRTVVNFLKSRA